MPQSFIAGGNIPPSRFVSASTPNRTVTLSASGDLPMGISGKATHNVPGTIGGVAVDDGYAATAGMSIAVFGEEDSGRGQDIWLELGGTVAFGDLLKPDGSSTGKGITASSDGNGYGARALAAGVSGQLIKVEVIIGQRGA